jgi:hypothetical protein
MSVDYFDLSDGAKNQFVRDFCRVTGCAPLKGKTQRSSQPERRYLVIDGQPVAESRDGIRAYEPWGFTRKGVNYRRIKAITKTEEQP